MTHDALVTTEWLAAHLHDPDLRVVDTRGRVLPASAPLPHYYAHREEYEAAHIPGAVFVDWTTDLVEPGSHSYDIANPRRYAAQMSRLGVNAATLVVAYDDAGGMLAARVWWTLRHYGHAQAAVLDGGWQKWLAEGRPVSAEVPEIAPAVFVPRITPGWNKDALDILNAAPGTQIIDVRTPEEFSGLSSRARRAGHIPGALNLPRANLLAADGTLLPEAQLRLQVVAAGVRLDAPETIVYCNGGVSAAYGLLALQKLGMSGVSVYDGSWKDWGNDDSKPIIAPEAG